MALSKDKYYAMQRQRNGLAPSAPPSSTPAPGEYNVNKSQGTTGMPIPPANPNPIPLWEQIKSSVSNRPVGAEGRLLAEAFPAAGAAVGAMATAPFNLALPGTSIMGAGVGAIGGEFVRQGIGELTGQYEPQGQAAQESEALHVGAPYAAGEVGAKALRFGGALARDAVEGAGTGIFNFFAPKAGMSPAMPIERVERLRNRAPQVMDPLNLNEYTPSSLANDLRNKFNSGIERTKATWESTKDALVEKFGKDKVVRVKGVKKEMEQVLEKYGYDEKKQMDKRAVHHFQTIIDDMVGGGDMTVEQALNMNKRINREIKFAKARAVDPNYASDEAVVGEFKEILFKRLDPLDKKIPQMRKIYGAARQLERDAAPFLNSKDLPAALESADRKVTTDFHLVNRMADAFDELNPILESMRDSIAGQSFRRPIGNLFGQTYGRAANLAQRIDNAVPFSVLGPSLGAGANATSLRRDWE